MYSNMIATFTEMAARRSSVASLLLWLAVLGQGRESSEELNFTLKIVYKTQAIFNCGDCFTADRSMHR